MEHENHGMWIAGAIKRPGALRKKMGIGMGQTIPTGMLKSRISALRKKSAGKKTLPASQRRTFKQMILANTLRKLGSKKK